MSKQKSVTLYKFSELSDTAKERARCDHAANLGYSWNNEAFESLKELAKFFGGRIRNCEIDYFNCSRSSAEFDMPEMSNREIAGKLRELGTYNHRTMRGDGECKLTGVCFDEDAIDGFRIAFKRGKVSDLGDLMDAAFDSWLKAVQADCEWQYSDEQLEESSEVNDWWYDEKGEFMPGGGS